VTQVLAHAKSPWYDRATANTIEVTMSQSEKQQESQEARVEQVQDLPAESVDTSETDQVKGGAEPVGGKLGTKTMLPVEPCCG
jgi:hypothetical protein